MIGSAIIICSRAEIFFFCVFLTFLIRISDITCTMRFELLLLCLVGLCGIAFADYGGLYKRTLYFSTLPTWFSIICISFAFVPLFDRHSMKVCSTGGFYCPKVAIEKNSQVVNMQFRKGGVAFFGVFTHERESKPSSQQGNLEEGAWHLSLSLTERSALNSEIVNWFFFTIYVIL